MLIGLSGYKQSGKDALADALVDLGFTKVGMSDVLHDCMLILNPIVRVKNGHVERYAEICEQIGYVSAKEVPEVRRLLQVFGTDVGRAMLGEDVWVDAMARKLDAMDGDIVVTGVRFPNEARLVEAQGTLIRVERPGFTGDGHASEHGLDDWNFTQIVANDQDLDHLRHVARGLAS